METEKKHSAILEDQESQIAWLLHFLPMYPSGAVKTQRKKCMWVMFLLLSNPFSQSRCYIQCWTWPLSSEPVPSPGLVSGELGNEPAHLKHITSDISRGGEEGLLARKQGGFWLLETKFSNSTLLAESQPSSKQLSHGLQKKKKKKSDPKSPAPALHVDTTAFERWITFLGAETDFRRGERL